MQCHRKGLQQTQSNWCESWLKTVQTMGVLCYSKGSKRRDPFGVGHDLLKCRQWVCFATANAWNRHDLIGVGHDLWKCRRWVCFATAKVCNLQQTRSNWCVSWLKTVQTMGVLCYNKGCNNKGCYNKQEPFVWQSRFLFVDAYICFCSTLTGFCVCCKQLHIGWGWKPMYTVHTWLWKALFFYWGTLL